MQFGLQLPVQSQSSYYVEPWEAAAGPDAVAEAARAAERHGFAYVAVCDHVAVPEDRVEGMGATWYDPVATLSWLAGRTGRVDLLTHVYVPPTKPLWLAAKQLATLDLLSGGRLVLGVGTGHVEEEFAAVGADFERRGAVLDERIDGLRRLLGADDGEAVDGLVLEPSPVRRPPPIWVGGSSRRALRRAGEKGDGWLPQGTRLDEMASAVATVREHAERAGRDPGSIGIGGLALPVLVGEPSWDVGRWTTTGPPDRVAEQLATWRDVGVTHLQVRPRSRSVDEYVEQVARLGDDVLPALA